MLQFFLIAGVEHRSSRSRKFVGVLYIGQVSASWNYLLLDVYILHQDVTRRKLEKLKWNKHLDVKIVALFINYFGFFHLARIRDPESCSTIESFSVTNSLLKTVSNCSPWLCNAWLLWLQHNTRADRPGEPGARAGKRGQRHTAILCSRQVVTAAGAAPCTGHQQDGLAPLVLRSKSVCVLWTVLSECDSVAPFSFCHKTVCVCVGVHEWWTKCGEDEMA
jgi:hypothetical protein